MADGNKKRGRVARPRVLVAQREARRRALRDAMARAAETEGAAQEAEAKAVREAEAKAAQEDARETKAVQEAEEDIVVGDIVRVSFVREEYKRSIEEKGLQWSETFMSMLGQDCPVLSIGEDGWIALPMPDDADRDCCFPRKFVVKADYSFEYSEKDSDDVFEYRRVAVWKRSWDVVLPFTIPEGRLMFEAEWRAKGIRMSHGWEHTGCHWMGFTDDRVPYVLFFRQVRGTDPETGEAPPEMRKNAEARKILEKCFVEEHKRALQAQQEASDFSESC